ncbi:MAG TPA: MFS transporter [Candidatus Limnocylindria bacterium]|nr:MFS transporter [Candidatus Limnocylindria bacterium]
MRPVPRIPAFVLAVALGNLLVPLNSTMIVVALPLIGRDLGVDRVTLAWLVTSYLIAMASLQPIAGRLGDRFGRRRFMLGALMYFIVASVGAALAPNLLVLVLFRLQQAIAAAAVVPNSLALLRGHAAEGKVGTYFGISGATTSIGAAIGPLLGGLLSAIDWRLIFLVNLPLAGLALVMAWRSLPAGDPPRRTTHPDIAGAVALGVLLSLAAWTLNEAGTSAPTITIALLALVAVGAVVFVRYESRNADPALPPFLFGVRVFAAANVTIALANVALYGTFLAVPVILAGSGPDATIRGGVAISVQSVAMIVLSPVSGALVDRVGARWPTALGGLLIGAGLAILGLSGHASDFGVLLICLPITGAGVALTFPATRIAALDAVPARYAALASGVTSSSRYFGGIIGALVASLALVDVTEAAAARLFLILAASGVGAAVAGSQLPPRIAPSVDAEVSAAG